jgi:hypothetical protein
VTARRSSRRPHVRIPAVDSSGACGTGKDDDMKAAIYAAVLGLTLVFASASQAGHMM